MGLRRAPQQQCAACASVCGSLGDDAALCPRCEVVLAEAILKYRPNTWRESLEMGNLPKRQCESVGPFLHLRSTRLGLPVKAHFRERCLVRTVSHKRSSRGTPLDSEVKYTEESSPSLALFS